LVQCEYFCRPPAFLDTEHMNKYLFLQIYARQARRAGEATRARVLGPPWKGRFCRAAGVCCATRASRSAAAAMVALAGWLFVGSLLAGDVPIKAFLEKHCVECHSGK